MGRTSRYFRENAWIRNIYPFYLEVRSLEPALRRDYVRDVARVLSLAENTVHRQFAALMFVENEGIDLLSIPHGVALLSLETIAKIIRHDPKYGRQLLEETIDRRWTITMLLELYNERYRHMTRQGGYQKANDALASLYAMPPKDPPKGLKHASLWSNSSQRPAIHDVVGVPSPPVRVHTGERLSLVVRRIFETGAQSFTPPFTVTYRGVEANPAQVAVRPLLSVQDSSGHRTDVFSHDGSKPTEVKDLRLLYALARSLMSASSVQLYANETSKALGEELQVLAEVSDLRLDIRQGPILGAETEISPLDRGAFPDKAAVYQHFRIDTLRS